MAPTTITPPEQTPPAPLRGRLAAWLGGGWGLLSRWAAHERAPRPPAAPLSVRLRLWRWFKTLLAFAATLAVLAAAYGWLIAETSRVRLEPRFAAATAEPGAGRPLAAAAAIYARRATLPTALEEGALFVPTTRRVRARLIQDGMENAAERALAALVFDRGERDPALRAALAAAATPKTDPGPRAEAAGAALNRLAAQVEAGTVAVDAGPVALAAFARTGGAALRARADGVGAVVDRARGPLWSVQAETLFFTARGEAYGWAALMRAMIAAAPAEAAPRLAAPAAAALATLDRAAAANPLIVVSPGRTAIVPANPLASLGFDLARAALALGALAEAAEAAGAPPARGPGTSRRP